MKGYYNKYLSVDLTREKIDELPLQDEDLKKFVGGSTLAANIIYDYVKPGMDPLAPESPMVFANGPFVGTVIPMVSRTAICGIAPHTGIWGEATTGGSFPFKLKGAGVDGILITGKASRPVYIAVKEGVGEIKDASHLWGKGDTYEVQDKIKEEVGANASIACTGLAGEKLISYSSIMNDNGRAAGRCGMGALMGSKNLKALAVSGKMKTEYANGKAMKQLAKEARFAIMNQLNTSGYTMYGTNWYMDLSMRLGDAPAKYFTKSVFPSHKVGGPVFREKYHMRNFACMGCPIGCGREIRDFSAEIKRVDGPEYETVGSFGPLCMNFDTDSIVKANHLCNLYGIDTISAGVSIAYAMHLYEKGVLTREKAGMELKWGDGGLILKLVEMIARQEGIGILISKGVRRMAQELGSDPEEAAHVKGLEFPMHDPRAYQGQALSYAVGPRGACHLKGSFYNMDAPGVEHAMEIGITFSDRNDPKGKGAMAAKVLNFGEIYNSFTMCEFSPTTAPIIADTLTAITGIPIKPMELYTFGERSLNLKRAINNILGVTRQHDNLPKLVTRALKEGSTAGREPDMDVMLKEYYEVCQWDWETGKPTREKLIEMGLSRQAKDLWG